jgi:hypothetical protein
MHNQANQDKILIEQIIASVSFQKKLEPEKAKENLNKGLVEIVYSSGYHCGNALLIGGRYLITNRHVIENNGGIRTRKVKIASSIYLELESKYLVQKNNDLALAIIKYLKIEPLEYNFSDEFIRQKPIILLTQRDNERVIKSGFLTYNGVDPRIQPESLKEQIKDYWGLSMDVKPGDSGGTVADLNGSIIGWISGTQPKVNLSTAVKSKYIINLLKAYHQYL